MSQGNTHQIQGTIICLLLAILAIPAQFELAGLMKRANIQIFKAIVILASVGFATSWYWRQFFYNAFEFHLYYVLFIAVVSFLAIFSYQARQHGTDSVIANCSGNYFTIFYLGLLSSFILGIRIEFGTLGLLMFIFTVKSSDIGAYTIGRLFGKHKLAPKISPGKTWEGMVGATIFAVIVAILFGQFCGIMSIWPAIAFGVVFAILGQLGDLIESMIKRDAQEKDSAKSVPGFGGVLDIIDSPLATAPAGYLFFMLMGN